jgi:two-component system, response regulator PdtaR
MVRFGSHNIGLRPSPVSVHAALLLAPGLPIQIFGNSMSSSHHPASEVSVLKGVSVLIVEDSWHVAKAIRSALEVLGMRIVGPAASAAEARRLVAEQKPKLALVDINLKTELAYDLIEELHRQGVLVIVVSGYAVPQMPAEIMAAFVQKPFSESDLIKVLRATAARLH